MFACLCLNIRANTPTNELVSAQHTEQCHRPAGSVHFCETVQVTKQHRAGSLSGFIICTKMIKMVASVRLCVASTPTCWIGEPPGTFWCTGGRRRPYLLKLRPSSSSPGRVQPRLGLALNSDEPYLTNPFVCPLCQRARARADRCEARLSPGNLQSLLQSIFRGNISKPSHIFEFKKPTVSSVSVFKVRTVVCSGRRCFFLHIAICKNLL